MAAAAKNISGLRLSFAIGTAIFTILPSDATATWMSALVLNFHAFLWAARVPLPPGASGT
jgi:hypothetical protein